MNLFYIWPAKWATNRATFRKAFDKFELALGYLSSNLSKHFSRINLNQNEISLPIANDITLTKPLSSNHFNDFSV